MRPDIVPGAIFPDYELSDHTAKRRKLSELQGQHPTVLVLSRGGYCPKDRRQAEGLLELYSEMEVGYCRLVTISTDNITETNEYRSGVGALIGPSSLTRGASFKRISTSPNIRIRTTIR
jgi:peroxiredoxin